MIIGERLSQLRKDKGLFQKDLARILGISRKSVSQYERELRSPPDDLKIKIANYFNVSLDYLMGLTKIEHYDENRYLILPANAPNEVKEKTEEYMNFLILKR
jgi:transcriptional regulator with XRE-family HTH domain